MKGAKVKHVGELEVQVIVDKNIFKKMFSKSEKYTFKFNTEEEMDEFIRLGELLWFIIVEGLLYVK